MASLKDMRVRIASTKATQKITKAMQMVAASKLRRAQTAAEAARPYAEKMDAVISNIATAAAGSPGAPALLAGTGNDQVHLLLVCTGERGLSGAFNSSIVRLARERALSLMNQGKEVKFFCVGRKGYEQLRRNFEKQIVENVELRSRASARLRQRRRHRQEGHRAFRGRRVRRLHAVLFALQVGDRAGPDRAADHSAGGGSRRPPMPARRRPTNTSRKRTRF